MGKAENGIGLGLTSHIHMIQSTEYIQFNSYYRPYSIKSPYYIGYVLICNRIVYTYDMYVLW